jgi:hypothetical protein
MGIPRPGPCRTLPAPPEAFDQDDRPGGSRRGLRGAAPPSGRPSPLRGLAPAHAREVFVCQISDKRGYQQRRPVSVLQNSVERGYPGTRTRAGGAAAAPDPIGSPEEWPTQDSGLFPPLKVLPSKRQERATQKAYNRRSPARWCVCTSGSPGRIAPRGPAGPVARSKPER